MFNSVLLLTKIASVEARLEEIRQLIEPSSNNVKLLEMIKNMLNQQLQILAHASQEHEDEHASQAERHNQSKIPTHSGEPGNILPASLDAHAAVAHEPENLTAVVATALGEVDILDRDINRYQPIIHPSNRRKKPRTYTPLKL